MKVKNFLIGEINSSSINSYIQNFKIDNKEDFYCLHGNFFIDGYAFLPIELRTLSISLDLFTFTHKIKFEKYFTESYFNLLKNNTSNIKVLKKCFVIGNDENYYHNLLMYLSKIAFLINNEKLISKIDYILFNKNLPIKFIKLIEEILKIKKINKKIRSYFLFY